QRREVLQALEGSPLSLRGAIKLLFDELEFLPACTAERFERIEFSEIMRRREHSAQLVRSNTGLPIRRENSHATHFTFAHYRTARNEPNAAENSVKRHNLVRPLDR